MLRRAKAWVEAGRIQSSFGIAMTVVGLEFIEVVKMRHRDTCCLSTLHRFQVSIKPYKFFPTSMYFQTSGKSRLHYLERLGTGRTICTKRLGPDQSLTLKWATATRNGYFQ